MSEVPGYNPNDADKNVRKIDVSSTEYSQNVETERSRYKLGNKAFGVDAFFQTLKIISDGIEAGTDSEKIDQQVKERLYITGVTGGIRNFLEKGDHLDDFYDEIQKSQVHKGTLTLLKDLITTYKPDKKGANENTENLIQNRKNLVNSFVSLLRPGEIVNFLGTHIKNVEKQFKDFKYDNKADKKFAAKVLMKAVDDQQIPVSKELIRERLDNAENFAFDYLNESLLERVGEYTAETERIGMAVGLEKPERKKVYVHECLHALSGRTIKSGTKIRGLLAKDSTMTTQRFGLKFDSKETDKEDRSRFTWLNEAVTEQLAMMVTETEGSTAYQSERLLLSQLMDSGRKPLPFSIFIEAYFENFEPNSKSKIPMWHKLMKEIDDAYEPGFLLKLDKVYQREGFKGASSLLNEYGIQTDLETPTDNIPK